MTHPKIERTANGCSLEVVAGDMAILVRADGTHFMVYPRDTDEQAEMPMLQTAALASVIRSAEDADFGMAAIDWCAKRKVVANATPWPEGEPGGTMQ